MTYEGSSTEDENSSFFNESDQSDTYGLEIDDSEGTRLMENAIFELSDRYRFIQRICCSSNSTVVYRALDMEKENNIVAVKLAFFPRSLAANNDYPSEYTTLKKAHQARHCQRILYFSLLSDKRVAALVSPFYEGNRLPGTIKKHNDIRCFMYQLVQFLYDIHSCGIIHRDIKLSNSIWNKKSRTLTVIDFDLATIQHSDGHTRYAGTEGFTSPEMRAIRANIGTYERLEQKPYNEKTDMYSAGVVFACLLMDIKECEMQTSKLTKRLKRVRKTNWRPCNNLLLQLLNTNPESRISAKDALQHEYFTNSD